MPAEIEMFSKGDDAAYEEWVRGNVGYVLVERSGSFMLHQSRCGASRPNAGSVHADDQIRAGCARTRKPLMDFAEHTAGESPAL